MVVKGLIGGTDPGRMNGLRTRRPIRQKPEKLEGRARFFELEDIRLFLSIKTSCYITCSFFCGPFQNVDKRGVLPFYRRFD
jgi:hypothetical protein